MNYGWQHNNSSNPADVARGPQVQANEYILAAMLTFLCDRFTIIICNIISPTKYCYVAYGQRHAGISTLEALLQMQLRSLT